MANKDMDERTRVVALAAENAFWAAVAEAFPEAEFGDFSPDGAARFAHACHRAVKEWVSCNVPPACIICGRPMGPDDIADNDGELCIPCAEDD
jgi:hypothetical protein